MRMRHQSARGAKPAARRFAADRRGATAIEYGLIVSLVFLAIAGSVKAFTSTTNEKYDAISSTIDDALN